MSPGASLYDRPHDIGEDHGGVVWPSVIAILFATLSVISFAVDQSVTLSSPPELPAYEAAR